MPVPIPFSEEIFQILFDETSDGIFLADRRGVCLTANPRLGELLGVLPQEMEQFRIMDFFFGEDDRQQFEWSIPTPGKKLEWKARTVRLKSGEDLLADITLQELPNRRILGIVRDISPLKMADEELRDSEAHLRESEATLRESQRQMKALITSLDDIVFEYDEQGNYCNIWAAKDELLVSPREEMLGRKIEAVLGEDLARVFKEAFRRVLRSSQSENVEYFLEIAGQPHWFMGHISPILSTGGEYRTVSFLARDITASKLAEKALQAKTEELEALFSVSTHLRQAQTVDEMLPLVLEEVCRVLSADASAAILLEPDERHFRFALANGPLEKNKGLLYNTDKGISAEILRTRQPFATADYASSPLRLTELSNHEQLGPAVFVPLQSEAQFLGILQAARLRGQQAEPFSESTTRLLATIGEMVGTALRRLRLYEEAQRRLTEVQALRDIDLTIIGSVDLRLSMRTILERVCSQMRVDAVSVLMLHPHRLELEYTAGQGFHTKAITQTTLRLGEGYAGRAALERQTIFIPDLRERGTDFLRAPIFREEGFVSYFAVPLLAKGQVKGVLEIFHRSPLDPGAEWVDFLETLAGQAAIAIDNAGLFNDLQRSNQELVLAYDATIEGWSRALDLRDRETEGHTQRVTDMTLRLARATGMSEVEQIHVRRGALLHDIGKMGIPDMILLKPGALTEEEWVVMRRHPVYAFEMLAPITYLRPALDIPYCHHEKWDGSGYPRGLKGEEIPLSARIFAVVDVWDAVTSNRPYRPAWSTDTARDYIREQTGKQFDPHVVEMFLRFMLMEE